MKKVEHWVCDLCKTEYNEKEKAKECEKNHKTPVEIESARYLPCTYDCKGYPIELNVKMSDGEIVSFKRRSK